MVLDQRSSTDKGWLTSFDQLQLASLATCGDCRKNRSFHVRFGHRTPIGLLSLASARSNSSASIGSSNIIDTAISQQNNTSRGRVPALRITKLTLLISVEQLSRRGGFGDLSTSLLQLSINESAALREVSPVLWPPGLLHLTLGPYLSQPVDQVWR